MVMKKYFIAVAAMAFLAACSGKQAQKDVPVEVEEEEFAIMSAAPDAPSLPLIHSVKATQPAKPVNMRDSSEETVDGFSRGKLVIS